MFESNDTKWGYTSVKRVKTLRNETGSEGAKNEGKKRCEKKRWYDRKEITSVICRVES